MPIPHLNLPDVDPGHCRDVVGRIYDVGAMAPLNIDLTGVERIGLHLGPRLDAPDPGQREVVARYLYLNAVIDQARDSEGIAIFLARAVDRIYRDLGIPMLDEPLEFFAKLDACIRVIEEEHERIRAERAPHFPRISGYSLYDQYRVTPWVAFRWGAPLGNVLRFMDTAGGLLAWLDGFVSGEMAARAIKEDRLYGLGGAIGEKASRLFIKWCAFTAHLEPGWPLNSYEVPLDANVGRVLMRSGYLFAFLDQEDMSKGSPQPWTEQPGGRVNLSAQSLNDRPLKRTATLDGPLIGLLESWGLGRSRTNLRLMKTLNVILAQARGPEARVGQLDDGFMRIGRDLCRNSDPRCPECPLRTVCLANNGVQELKTTFYCGTGSNVFWGR